MYLLWQNGYIIDNYSHILNLPIIHLNTHCIFCIQWTRIRHFSWERLDQATGRLPISHRATVSILWWCSQEQSGSILKVARASAPRPPPIRRASTSPKWLSTRRNSILWNKCSCTQRISPSKRASRMASSRRVTMKRSKSIWSWRSQKYWTYCSKCVSSSSLWSAMTTPAASDLPRWTRNWSA